MANFNERREEDRSPSESNGEKIVYTPYITRNGERIYHPDWPPGVYRFTVPIDEGGEDETDQ
jgi:hypothetical protein